MIKNIVFDMGNVIIDYNPQRIVNETTADPVERDLLFNEIFRSNGWRLLDQGLITFDEHYQDLVSRLPEYAGKIQWLLDHWDEDQPLLNGIFHLIQQLKNAGFALYLLSNASDRFYVYAPGMKIFDLFDGLTLSSELKLLKPDPEIYHRFCEIHHLIPQECLFIDDTKENVTGAINAGWHAVQFQGVTQLREYLSQVLDTHLS